METKYIDSCEKCPYYRDINRLHGDPAYCGHSSAPQGYSGAITQEDLIAKWCPIKDGHVKVQRDSNDIIVSETKLVVTGRII